MKKIVALLLTVAFFAISLGASSSEGSLSQVQIQKVTSESGFMNFRISGLVKYENGTPAVGHYVFVNGASGMIVEKVDSNGYFNITFPCENGSFSWGIVGLPTDQYLVTMTRTYGFYYARIVIKNR